MSRIVRGASTDVKSIKMSSHSKAATTAYQGLAFRSMQVEGTVTLAELEVRKSEAYEEGKRAGIVEAEQRLGQPLRTSLDNLENVLDEISQFRRELFKEAETEVLEMVLAVSKKIVAKELALDPSLIKGVVEKGLELVEKQRKIVLQMNPADFQFFQKSKPDFLHRFKAIEELEFLYDSSVAVGSVLLQTKTVQLNLNLEQMVDHLMNGVTEDKHDFSDVNAEEEET